MSLHQAMPTLDILFRAVGTEVPIDHGYTL